MAANGIGTETTVSTEDDAITSIQMDDIMDVVYSYKCKFCSFSGAKPADITNHVVSAHLSKGGAKKTAAVATQDQSNAQESASEVGSQTKSGGLVTMETSLQTDVDPEEQTDDERANEGTTIFEVNEEAQVDEEAKVEGEDESGLRELYLCGQCNLGFTAIEECKTHMAQEHNVILQNFNSEVMNVPAATSSSHTDVNVVLPPNKVSVGTQAQMYKKPGRKRKIKPPETATTATDSWEQGQASRSLIMLSKVLQLNAASQPSDKATRDVSRRAAATAVSMKAEEEDDGGRSALGKRRVRMPSALRQDYYVGRRKHKKRQKPPKPVVNLSCPRAKCSIRFRTEEGLQLHVNTHACDESLMRFKCNECDFGCPSWIMMNNHLWTIHQLDADLHKCDRCEYRAVTPHRLAVHQEIHSECSPYSCDICGKSFKQRSQLKNHEVIHKDRSEVTVKWYTAKACKICGRKLANQKALQQHIASVHEKVRPYVCNFCGHATSRRHMLLLHLRTHTGEKPYKCDICTYSTGDHNSLRRHRMRHTGQRPYKCPHCVYSCIQSVALKTHLKNKHPGLEGIYSCDTCQYHTLNKPNWEQHMEDHRNGLISDQPDDSRPPRGGPRRNNRSQPAATVTTTSEDALEANAEMIEISGMLQGQQVTAVGPDGNTMFLTCVEDGTYTFTADNEQGEQVVLAVQDEDQSTVVLPTSATDTVQLMVQDGSKVDTLPISIMPQSGIETMDVGGMDATEDHILSGVTNNVLPDTGQIIATAAEHANIISPEQDDGTNLRSIVIGTLNDDGNLQGAVEMISVEGVVHPNAEHLYVKLEES